jgi:hypothetical protein
MLAVVHVVTLGCVTASILGLLYLVGPIALRVRLPATWLDYVPFTLMTLGMSEWSAILGRGYRTSLATPRRTRASESMIR